MNNILVISMIIWFLLVRTGIIKYSKKVKSSELLDWEYYNTENY